MALTTKIVRSVDITYTGAGDADLQTRSSVGQLKSITTLASGTGSSQANIAWSDEVTLTTGATADIDLAAVLTDVYGTALTFVKIKSIMLKAAATNTTILTVGNGTNPWVGPFGVGTHTLALAPGVTISLDNPVGGWTVTAGTGDIIKVANAAGASATYEVMIVGTNA